MMRKEKRCMENKNKEMGREKGREDRVEKDKEREEAKCLM